MCISKIDVKLYTMKEDFSELIIYLDKRFGVIDERFGELRSQFSDLQTSVDTYAHKADAYFQELVMLSRQVDRLDRWIHEIAEKVGVQLKSWLSE